MCYRVTGGFTTRRVKDLKALMPDDERARTWATVRVDFESTEAALLAEMTEKAHKSHLADPFSPGSNIAILYGEDEVLAVAVVDSGPMTSGSMEVSRGIVSDQETMDLVARMTS